MEFRNQFLHNIECSSFKIAIKLLGTDKENKLLRFDDTDNEQDTEVRYKSAFRNLYLESLKIVSKKLKDRRKQIEDRRQAHENLIGSQIYIMDKYFETLDTILQICEDNVSEIPEVMQLINKLSKKLSDDMELTFSSEKFSQLQIKLNELHTPERIKAYLKR